MDNDRVYLVHEHSPENSQILSDSEYHSARLDLDATVEDVTNTDFFDQEDFETEQYDSDDIYDDDDDEVEDEDEDPCFRQSSSTLNARPMSAADNHIEPDAPMSSHYRFAVFSQFI